MLSRFVTIGVLVAVSFTSKALGTAKQTDVPVLSLCSIAESPAKYNGKTIRVKARLQSAGMHGWYIYDESCSHFGVGLFIESKAEGNEDLHRAINWGEFGTSDKIVFASFIGVFRLNRTDESPPRELIVRRMGDFKSTPKVKQPNP